MSQPAILALANGSLFRGIAIGSEGHTTGEVVFNTSMTGYQEILTDPSYTSQIVTLTYPHIGNVGTNSEDKESEKIWAAGLIIRNLSPITSNFRSEKSLDNYLKQHNCIGIADIDTRRLTRIIRTEGAMGGCIMTGTDEKAVLEMAHNFSGLQHTDLAKDVTTAKPYEWTESTWEWAKGHTAIPKKELPYHVVVYDFGVKRNILRMLADRGCRLTVVPAKTSAKKVMELKPNGVFLSNGPGDPAACSYAITAAKELLEHNIPLFGICLGHQLLALASGAKTVKMKFGHHGTNHPVIDLKTKQVFITSQNHGFAVDKDSLPKNLNITHLSLFDDSIQGIEYKKHKAFSFQGHPEASPGPHDLSPLFDTFVKLMMK